MSVGNSDLDHQHRRLIDTANMVRGLSGDEDAEIIQAALDEVVEYILHHLDFEEDLLAKNSYKGLIEHKKKHEFFRECVQTIYANKSIATSKMLSDTMDRLIDHIMNDDKEYICCL
ncbi:bacteriohemerythrin [Magnetospirillum sp. ME-1]|uniref:bacteriohemerythrin n=1 Tax=Magnetospirillum sp. ME-1 TaxID=1639348 RepID=UPI00143DE3EE|nr:hemerythrin domain-containing protein [Magnetospirillum sp. ME-1]